MSKDPTTPISAKSGELETPASSEQAGELRRAIENLPVDDRGTMADTLGKLLEDEGVIEEIMQLISRDQDRLIDEILKLPELQDEDVTIDSINHIWDKDGNHSIRNDKRTDKWRTNRNKVRRQIRAKVTELLTSHKTGDTDNGK